MHQIISEKRNYIGVKVNTDGIETNWFCFEMEKECFMSLPIGWILIQTYSR